MLRPWLPTCMTQPMITSSIRAGSRSLRSARERSTSAARSAGCQPDSFPNRLPPGVRTASTITAVAMVAPPRRRARLETDQPELTSRSRESADGTDRIATARRFPEGDERLWRTERRPAWRRSASADIDRTVEGRTPARDFVATVTAHGERHALRWKDGDGWAGWTFAEYGDRVARAASRVPGHGPLTGRAHHPDDAQHPRVPRARHGRPHVRRHADLGLQLVVVRPDRLPGRALRSEGRGGRGRRLPRPLHAGARPARRPEGDRDAPPGRCRRARWPSMSPRCSSTTRPTSRRRPRAVARTTWPRSSTPRARPVRPRA